MLLAALCKVLSQMHLRHTYVYTFQAYVCVQMHLRHTYVYTSCLRMPRWRAFSTNWRRGSTQGEQARHMHDMKMTGGCMR